MLFEHITPSIIIPLVNKFPDSLIINGVYLTGLRLIKEKPKINAWKIARFITIQGKLFLLFFISGVLSREAVLIPLSAKASLFGFDGKGN